MQIYDKVVSVDSRAEKGLGVANMLLIAGVHQMRNGLILCLVSLGLVSCGGGGSGSSAPSTFSITGSISGYSGQVVLSNNGAAMPSITSPGPFTIAANLSTATDYDVTIPSPPSGYDCTVANGGPATATANVIDIAVTCVPWSVTGTISGFAGSVDVLNGTTTIPVSSEVSATTFTIDANATDGTTYAVAVPVSPPGYVCNVANGIGTVTTTTGSISDVVVHCVPVNWTWKTINSQNYLVDARRNHTASSLSNGSILVTGGVSDGPTAIRNSSELLDISNTWSATGALSVPRYSHTATVMNDGRVLVVGGNVGGTATDSAEIYSTGTWSLTSELQNPATTHLTDVRYDHSATLLDDGTGRILVTGGFSGASALASSEIFDPSTGIWSAASPLTDARDLHTATSLQDGTGSVLAVGGNSQAPLATAELYDAVLDVWNPTTGDMSTPRYSHTATLLPNGKVLVVGGLGANGLALASAELYDPASGLWTTTTKTGGAPALTTGRYGHTSTLRSDGVVVITGGIGTVALKSTELYDALTDTWINPGATADLDVPRKDFTATLRTDETVCVIGGSTTGGTQLTSIVLYGPP